MNSPSDYEVPHHSQPQPLIGKQTSQNCSFEPLGFKSADQNSMREASASSQTPQQDHQDINLGSRGLEIDFSPARMSDSKPIWTVIELERLFEFLHQTGTRWILIKKELKYWPQGYLKNKFNGSLRKLLRRIITICRSKTKNACKEVKFNTMISIIHFPEGKSVPGAETSAKELRRLIFNQAVKIEKQQEEPEELAQIQRLIHQFASCNRNYLMNAGKKKNGPTRTKQIWDEEDQGFHNIIIVKMSSTQQTQGCVRIPIAKIEEALSGHLPKSIQKSTLKNQSPEPKLQ